MNRWRQTCKSEKIGITLILLSLALALSLSACQNGSGGKDRDSIEWLGELETAMARSKESGRILMVDFTAVWCPPCKAMEDSTFSDPDVIKKAGSFVTLRIDVDNDRETAEKYNGNARKYGGIGIPNILFMTGDGERLKQVVGYHSPQKLVAVMDSVLAMSRR